MTTAQRPIRIGLIGAGGIGTVHLQEFGKLRNECEIVAIADTYLSAAEQRAKQFGVPEVSPTPEALVARDDLDAVIVAVPNRYHKEWTVAALQSGKHVLVEKPMGLNVADAKEIVRAQRQYGKVVMVGHQMRWEWLPLRIKEQIDRGELGRVYTAKTGWFRRKGIPGWGTWFTRMEESGGGPLIDIGVHMIDLAFFLMGEPKPVSVFGAVYAEFGPRRKGIGSWGKPDWNGYFDVEDLATALIRMDDGRTLTLEVSWAANVETDNQPFVHLLGSEGGAVIRGETGKFLTERFDEPIDVPIVPPADDEGARVRLSRHFLECIREGKQPWTSAETGLRSNLIIEAIYESSRTGREVVLDWSL
jgi:predicted dehydrogenase